MKNKLLLGIGILVVQLIPLRAWNACRDFLDYYHFSLYDLELQLIYAINHDQEMPLLLARIFHNKLLQFFIDIYKRYTHFFDWQLLITLISFVGVFGVILAIWYFLESKKRNRRIGMLILFSFLFPLAEVIINFKVPFIFKITLIAFSFNLLSLFGHFQFLQEKNRKIVMLVYLILISLSLVWMILIPDQALKYCEKP